MRYPYPHEVLDALRDWRHGDTILDNGLVILDIATVFDHDYLGVHLLVAVHHKKKESPNYQYKGYQLLFIGHDEYTLRATWRDAEQGYPPFMKAGSIVENWLSDTTKEGK